MEKAAYGSVDGQEMDVGEFLDRATQDYKQKGIFPYCKGCSEIVHIYASHDPDIWRFDHHNLPEGAKPWDDCVQADRGGVFGGLKPDGWDHVRGAEVRRQFFEDANIKRAYSFCWRLAGKGALPVNKFNELIERADKKRIWSYVNLPLWLIPYILLTLNNFENAKRGGGTYEFHFVIKKTKSKSISELWTGNSPFFIEKFFSHSNRNGGGSQSVATANNPYPISEDDMNVLAGDGAWIDAVTLRALRRLA